jgi:hypothetical protein
MEGRKKEKKIKIRKRRKADNRGTGEDRGKEGCTK